MTNRQYDDRMTLSEIQANIHEWAKEKGWWDTDRNFGEMLALMHSEISESLEAWRKNEAPVWTDGNKPEGFLLELADAVIRILDTCENFGYDLGQLIKIKMEYNETRPYRHGGLRA